MADAFGWNPTTWLNLGFLALAAVLAWRFLVTGGPDMLARMGRDPEDADCSAGSGHAHDHVHVRAG